jgi:hypothetical protein
LAAQSGSWRKETRPPFGVSRKKGLLGGSEDNKSFVETKVVGKIDLSESAQAALHGWRTKCPSSNDLRQRAA